MLKNIYDDDILKQLNYFITCRAPSVTDDTESKNLKVPKTKKPESIYSTHYNIIKYIKGVC